MQDTGAEGKAHASACRAMLQAAHNLVARVPLFLPLLVIVGVILDSPAGWVCAATGLVIGCLLRVPRIVLCSILCGVLVGLTQNCRERSIQQVLSQADSGAVQLKGTVVSTHARSYVLETGWLGLRAEIRSEGEYRPGDKLVVVAIPVKTTEPPVEGMFSPEKQIRGQGLCGIYNALQTEKTGVTWGIGTLRRLADEYREKMTRRIMPPGTEADARRQVLCALVLGEKSGAAPETIDVFRRSGCLHAFAVSGLHVGIVAWLVGLLLRAFRVHPRIGRIAILIATGTYVIITGMAVPALRAYAMLAVLLGGLILRRRVSLANTWCCAASVVLLVQPWQLYQAGFLLSFAVYASICLGVHFCMGDSPWFGPDDYLPARLRNGWERFQVSFDLALRGALVVSLCAWLVSLPLTMELFHVVNTCSYVTNLVLVPVLPVVMALGLLWILLGWIPLLGPALGSLALHGATFLLGIVGFFSNVPGAYLSAQPPAKPDEMMLLCMTYGKSICMLGNPGVLLGNVGAEGDARYTIQPAIFHSGFTPAWIYGTAKDSAAGKIYARSWSGAIFCSPKEPISPTQLRTPAGSFFLYPPAKHLPRRSADNHQPVVLWEKTNGQRVLYAGNAAQSTLESIPASQRRADILILGYNHREPVEEPGLLREIGAQLIILLPSTKPRNALDVDAKSVRIEQLSAEEKPFLRLPTTRH